MPFSVPRLLGYGCGSTLVAAAVVGNSLRTKPNFYAAAVTVGQSSGALMVLANFVLVVAICVGLVIKTIFFGTLRRVEVEHMYERLFIFVSESLLALTIFRDDFSATFALLFGLLCFVKCFHWITADRVDYMEQIPHPGPSRFFLVRILGITSILIATDVYLFWFFLDDNLLRGVSAMLLFTTEYMILIATILGTSARYIVNVVDMYKAAGRADAPTWEMKSRWMFYIDLFVDFAKLLTYLAFFCVIFISHGLPLHILRDVFMTFRSFVSRAADFVRYQAVTYNMDHLYENATHAELEASGDKTCIICREEMVAIDAPAETGTPTEGTTEVVVAVEGEAANPGEVESSGQGENATTRTTTPAAAPAPTPVPTPTRRANDGPNETPKKLPCGHTFHCHCLRSWLERQQSCPTCRRELLDPVLRQRRRNVARPPAPAPAPAPAPGAAPTAAGVDPAPTPAPVGPHPGGVPTHTSANAQPATPGEGSSLQGTAAQAAPTAGPSTGFSPPLPPQPQQQQGPLYRHLPRFMRPDGARATPDPPPPQQYGRVPGPTTRLHQVDPRDPQSMYNQYFQPPSQQIPPPQVRVWQGPFTPGQYFARPLGAAPRFPPGRPMIQTHNEATLSSRGHGEGSHPGTDFDAAWRFLNGDRSGDTNSVRAMGSTNATASKMPSGPASTFDPPGTSDSNQIQNQHSRAPTLTRAELSSASLNYLPSGLNTPHTSNPPQIFSSLSVGSTSSASATTVNAQHGDGDVTGANASASTSTSVPRTRSYTRQVRERQSSNDSDRGADGGIHADADDAGRIEDVQLSDVELRRAMAEAAMRRLGRTSSSTLASTSDAGVGVPSALYKGKGKATDQGTTESNTTETVSGTGVSSDASEQRPDARRGPFLSLPRGIPDYAIPPHLRAALGDVGLGVGEGNGKAKGEGGGEGSVLVAEGEVQAGASGDALDQAIEERVELLRRADEVLRGVVGQLKRAKEEMGEV